MKIMPLMDSNPEFIQCSILFVEIKLHRDYLLTDIKSFAFMLWCITQFMLWGEFPSIFPSLFYGYYFLFLENLHGWYVFWKAAFTIDDTDRFVTFGHNFKRIYLLTLLPCHVYMILFVHLIGYLYKRSLNITFDMLCTIFVH